MNIKVTPFVLFLILLAVLVISILFGNALKTFLNKESFINFNNNTVSQFGNPVYIPQYSKDPQRKVISLYDNIFFDTKNANLIEVNGKACKKGNDPSATVAACVDSVGQSIDSIIVVPRDNINIDTYPTQKSGTTQNIESIDTFESLYATVNNSIEYFSYTTHCITTDMYQVFYFPINTNTFVHIMNIDQQTYPAKKTATDSADGKGANVITYAFAKDQKIGQTTPYGPSIVNVPVYGTIGTAAPTNCSNSDNGKLITYPLYSAVAKIVQVTNYVKYDFEKGHVVINTNTAYKKYDRSSGKEISGTDPTTFENLKEMRTMTLSDGNNGLVLVMAIGNITTVAVINGISGKLNYDVTSCYSFDKNGLLDSNSNSNFADVTTGTACSNVTPAVTSSPGITPSATKKPKTTPTVTTTTTTKPTTMGTTMGRTSAGTKMPTPGGMSLVCGDDLSCKWFWYFNSMGQGNSILPNGKIDSNSILKTQIVPPVCPQCPQCTGKDVCTNCGGNGGSGTDNTKRDKNGNIIKDAVGGGVGLAKDAVGGGVGLAKDAVGGGVGLAKDAVGGTVGLAKEAVGGTVGLAKEAVGGAVGLVKDTLGGAVGLVKDAGRGISNLGTGPVRLNTNNRYNNDRNIDNRTGRTAQGLQSVSDNTQGVVSGISQSAPIDNYSYYGALESKGSEFMPVTADFSKFGR